MLKGTDEEEEEKSSSKSPVRPRLQRAASSVNIMQVDDGADVKLLRRVDRFVPRFQLEIVSLSTMYAMVFVMWLLGSLIVITQIVIIGVFSTAHDPTLGIYNGLFEAIFAIEGIMRTVGACLLLLLLISFPQRVILHAYRNFGTIFPSLNQKLIILMIFLMSITPCFTLYEIVAFWSSFYNRDGKLDVPTANQPYGSGVPLGILSLLFSYSESAVLMNVVMSMIVLAFTSVYFGGVYHFQYQSAMASFSHEPPVVPWSLQLKKLFGAAKRTLKGEQEKEDEEDDAEAQEDDGENGKQLVDTKAYREEMKHFHAQSVMVKILLACRKPFELVKGCFRSYKTRTGGLPVTLQLVALIYLAVLLSFSFATAMNPSNVPLVSIVTVIRLCSMNVTALLASQYNFTQDVTAGDVHFYNATFVLDVKSYIESDKAGACSPYQPNPIVFHRTVGVCVFFILELVLFYMVFRMERKTAAFLKETSYVNARSEILGFNFFRGIARVCWLVMIAGGIFSAAINPNEVYTVSQGSILYINATNTFYVNFTIDPMFQVGVGIGTMGFGPFFVMLMLWILYLAFAYLPADSVGMKGWFVGDSWREGEEALQASLRRYEYLVMVTEECDVAHLLAIQDRERLLTQLVRSVGKKGDGGSGMPSPKSSVAGMDWDAFLQACNLEQVKTRAQRTLMVNRLAKERAKSTMLMGIHSTDFFESQLVRQIQANLLVLETEILNFHFMHLSYVLAGKKVNPITKQKQYMSLEEQQAMVEDKRFTMVAHIIHEATDTHVMVFTSADRVIVAFRGTVSLTNWQTDFDSSEVVCEYVVNIEPELSDIPAGALNRARRVANRPPRVHGGFVKAYESVRAELTEVCRKELTIGKVLFITGHSLGAGLATLCTVDLAGELRLPRGRIALTTWASPKVGTFSFFRRFLQICPCTKRFSMVDDPIPKMPLDKPFQTITLNGWWHCGTEILMNSQGNMLIRPTPIERFMLQKNPLGQTNCHLRMTYATALMIWVVRSHPDYTPDWWSSLVTMFYRTANKRLNAIPRNLRDRLLESLLRAGVTYVHNNKLVRDMMIDTTLADEDEVDATMTDMLVAYREKDQSKFANKLAQLSTLHTENKLFRSDGLATKRKRGYRDRENDEVLDEDGDIFVSARQFPVGDNSTEILIENTRRMIAEQVLALDDGEERHGHDETRTAAAFMPKDTG